MFSALYKWQNLSLTTCYISEIRGGPTLHVAQLSQASPVYNEE